MVSFPFLHPSSPEMTGDSDEALVAAIAERRDRGAFAELFDRYAGRIQGFLVKGGLPPERADDLTQEILLEVWRRADRFDPARARAATWIFTIARSRRIDALRRERLPEVQPEGAVTAAPSADELVERERAERRLRVALAALPAEQRAVLDAAYYGGSSMTDIADAQRVPIGTVKSRARLALERLRALIGSTT